MGRVLAAAGLPLRSPPVRGGGPGSGVRRPGRRRSGTAVPVNALVPAVDPDTAARLTAEAVAAGVTTVKVKVGGGLARRRRRPGGRGAGGARPGGADPARRQRRLGRRRRRRRPGPAGRLRSRAGRAAGGRPGRPRPWCGAGSPFRSPPTRASAASATPGDWPPSAPPTSVVVKVQPLGGVRAALRVIEAAGVPAVVSSLYETSDRSRRRRGPGRRPPRASLRLRPRDGDAPGRRRGGRPAGPRGRAAPRPPPRSPTPLSSPAGASSREAPARIRSWPGARRGSGSGSWPPTRGARGGRRDRRPGRTRPRSCRRCRPPAGRPAPENLSSYSPAMRRTGMASSSSRSHTGSWAPVPSRRRADASPSTVPARRSSTPAAARGRRENSCWASQPSMNASRPLRSRPPASRSSISARAARAAGSSIPAVAPSSARASTRSGRSRATRRASRPPSE